MIDRVYCLSLPDDMARKSFMLAQFKSQFTEEKYEFVDAYDIKSKEVRYAYKHLYDTTGNISSLAQISISLGHTKCLDNMITNKIKIGMIIEDDIRLVPDIKTCITNYLTDEIISSLNTKPTIIHLSNIANGYLSNSRKFIKCSKPIVNTQCYIINDICAQLLIDGLYPLKYQFDTYMYHVCGDQNVNEYAAEPLLAWDLSTTIYKKYWVKGDKEFHESIHRTSNNHKIMTS